MGDAGRSAAFYEALLGAAPRQRTPTGAVFELDSPPLVLTVEERPVPARVARATTSFALLVEEPRSVGDAAIALRRAGIRLRLEDAGIEVCDPDGNAWRVRFVGARKRRSVVAGAGGGP